MKKLFSLFVASLFTFSAFSADDKTLLFEDANKDSRVKYNISDSSEFPHAFRITNMGNGMAYRLFDVNNGPYLKDYKGIEIVFDYADPFDVPADLQFFFSINGFVEGSYPFVSSLMTDEPVVRINFYEQDENGAYVWPHLHTSTDPDVRFNRFCFRNGGYQGLKDENEVLIEYGSIIDVKLKSMALIDHNDQKEYFDILGGGIYEQDKNTYAEGRRLYGESMNFTIVQNEAGLSWQVEDTYKYANIHLATPLSTESIDKGLGFFVDQEYGTYRDAEGVQEGSLLIIVDIEGIEREFEISADEAGLELDVKEIVLSDTKGAGSSDINNVFVNDELPAFVNVYAISGQLIKMNVVREKALDGLAKGIYLVNKKKVGVY